MAGNVTVDRTIVRAVTVFAMLNLLVTLNNTPSRSWMYPAGLGALGCVLLTLSVLASLRDCFRPVPTWRGIRVLTYISLGLMAAHCLTVRDLSPRDYPPLLHACGVIILTAAAAFPLPTGCVLMGTYAVGFFFVRLQSLTVGQALTECLVLLVSGATGLLLVALVRRTVSIVSTRSDLTQQEARATARALAQARERARWDGLVHDKILGALRNAAAGDSRRQASNAQTLAREALAAFRADTHSDAPTALARKLEQVADALGLECEIDIKQDQISSEVLDVLEAAAVEALTNVPRHAGTPRVSVRAVIGQAAALLIISDRGRGFESQAPGQRAGLKTMKARMEAIGGQLDVRSTIGAGTAVTLSWSHEQPSWLTVLWDVRVFAPMIAIGAVDVILNVGLGLTRPARLFIPWLNPVLAAVVIGFNIAIAVCPRRPRLGWMLAACCVPLPAVSVLNLVTYGDAGWRYWAAGALTPAVGALSFRFRSSLGVSCCVASLLVLMVSEAILGRTSWAPVLGPFPVSLGVALVGGMLRRGLDGATAALSCENVRLAEQVRQAAGIAERNAEISRRRTALALDILPMLELIAGQGPLSVSEATECRLLEAAARDNLVAATLVNDAIAAAARAARGRGAEVVFRGADNAQPHAGLRIFRSLVEQICATIGAGSSARFVWNGSGRDFIGTAVVLGHEASAIRAVVESVAHSGLLTANSDDTPVLIPMRTH